MVILVRSLFNFNLKLSPLDVALARTRSHAHMSQAPLLTLVVESAADPDARAMLHALENVGISREIARVIPLGALTTDARATRERGLAALTFGRCATPTLFANDVALGGVKEVEAMGRTLELTRAVLGEAGEVGDAEREGGSAVVVGRFEPPACLREPAEEEWDDPMRGVSTSRSLMGRSRSTRADAFEKEERKSTSDETHTASTSKVKRDPRGTLNPCGKSDAVTLVAPKHPVDAAGYLKSAFAVVENLHTDTSTGLVDYVAIGRDAQFAEFENVTQSFRAIRLDEGELADENARKAFLLNVYNVAVKHAYVKFGVPKSTSSRVKFYRNVGYVIGNDFFTLDDIEHGLLRSNAATPSAMFSKRHFKSTDRRLRFALSHLDPRIHFALNCGANSCPPIRAYGAEKVDAQLDIAARAFLDGSVEVALPKIQMSKILRWYACDFGATPEEVLRRVAPFLRDDPRKAIEDALADGRVARKLKISYAHYDWGTNAGKCKSFSL
jgi:hypothetical protein